MDSLCYIIANIVMSVVKTPPPIKINVFFNFKSLLSLIKSSFIFLYESIINPLSEIVESFDDIISFFTLITSFKYTSFMVFRLIIESF